MIAVDLRRRGDNAITPLRASGTRAHAAQRDRSRARRLEEYAVAACIPSRFACERATAAGACVEIASPSALPHTLHATELVTLAT
jgi:hypothetical protein